MISSAQRQVCLLTSKGRASGEEPADGRQSRQLRSNAQVAMGARLTDIGAKFRAFQSAYISHMQRTAEFNQQRISTIPAFPTPPSSLGDPPEGGEDGASAGSQAQLHLSRTTDNHELMEERSLAIFRICQSVMELKAILEEMSTLAIQQGSMLDRIDLNMERADSYIHQAHRQIQAVAAGQQVSLKRKVVLLTLVVLILFTTIAILVK